MRSSTAARDLAERARARFVRGLPVHSRSAPSTLLNGRVVVLDPRFGHPRVSVAAEHTWLARHPDDDRLAITTDDAEQLRLVERPGATSRGVATTSAEVASTLDGFAPDLAIFRPGPGALPLIAVTERLLRRDVPLLLAIEDSWYDDLETTWPDRHRYWTNQLGSFAQRAIGVLASSAALGERLSAGVQRDVGVWVPGASISPQPTTARADISKLRLAAAPDLRPGYGANSLMLAGLAVHQSNATHKDDADSVNNAIVLSIAAQARGEGHTLSGALASLDGVDATPPGAAPAALADHYADADAVIFCQDFDGAASQRDSISDAVPAILATGRPVIAIGPLGNAAIEAFRESGAALVVDSPEPSRIAWCFDQLRDVERRVELGAAAITALEQLHKAQPKQLHRKPAYQEAIATRDRTPLDALRASHQGERCVIVGNGPSLRETELDLLDDEIVFASNAIHLLFDDVNWRPAYYSAVDPLYLDERSGDISQLLSGHPETTGIFPTSVPMHDDSGRIIRPDELLHDRPNAIFVRPLGEMSATSPYGAFSTDLKAGLVQPATVTIALLQIAAYLGFTEMVLIGCDTTYTIPGSVERSGPDVPGHDGEQLIITSTADDDPNHFATDYFGAGRSWHHPRVDNMIRHYSLSHEVLTMLDISVVNATVGGALEVFPRTSLRNALGRT